MPTNPESGTFECNSCAIIGKLSIMINIEHLEINANIYSSLRCDNSNLRCNVVVTNYFPIYDVLQLMVISSMILVPSSPRKVGIIEI